jgi:hypothetical protein
MVLSEEEDKRNDWYVWSMKEWKEKSIWKNSIKINFIDKINCSMLKE